MKCCWLKDADTGNDVFFKIRLMGIKPETCVSNPIQTIEGFNKRFGLTQTEGEMVKASFAQELGQTMWNVIQAYTGSARAPELTVEAAYRLERAGGQILALVK
jgi:hypothetical protein